METMGLHVGAGIDALATGPTPIHDDLVELHDQGQSGALTPAEYWDEVQRRLELDTRPWWRRALAFVGLGDE